MTDKTGQPPSREEIQEALDAVQAVMMNVKALLSFPPQLAVNIPNIRRCLLELLRITPV